MVRPKKLPNVRSDKAESTAAQESVDASAAESDRLKESDRPPSFSATCGGLPARDHLRDPVAAMKKDGGEKKNEHSTNSSKQKEKRSPQKRESPGQHAFEDPNPTKNLGSTEKDPATTAQPWKQTSKYYAADYEEEHKYGNVDCFYDTRKPRSKQNQFASSKWSATDPKPPEEFDHHFNQAASGKNHIDAETDSDQSTDFESPMSSIRMTREEFEARRLLDCPDESVAVFIPPKKEPMTTTGEDEKSPMKFKKESAVGPSLTPRERRMMVLGGGGGGPNSISNSKPVVLFPSAIPHLRASQRPSNFLQLLIDKIRKKEKDGRVPAVYQPPRSQPFVVPEFRFRPGFPEPPRNPAGFKYPRFIPFRIRAENFRRKWLVGTRGSAVRFCVALAICLGYTGVYPFFALSKIQRMRHETWAELDRSQYSNGGFRIYTDPYSTNIIND